MTNDIDVDVDFNFDLNFFPFFITWLVGSLVVGLILVAVYFIWMCILAHPIICGIGFSIFSGGLIAAWLEE